MFVPKYINPHLIKYAITSLLVAFFYIFVDDIYNIDQFSIRDRLNYSLYPSIASNIIDNNYLDSASSYLANEPIFLHISDLWNKLDSGIKYENFLIFISSFVSFYFLLRKSNSLIISFSIMFFPFVAVNYIMSLRQGLALSFLLLGIYSKKKINKILFIGAAPFIHVTFAVTLMLLLYTYLVGQFFKSKIIFSIVTLFAISIITYPAFFIARNFGVRQLDVYSNQNIIENSNTGLGFLLFILILSILIFSRNSKVVHSVIFSKGADLDIKFSILASMTYLLSYILFPPLARMMQNHALIVLLVCCLMGGFGSKLIYIIVFFISFVLLLHSIFTGFPANYLI